MKRITLILPAYNEGASILNTILEVDLSVPNDISAVIYVSEDGSSDDTRDQVVKAMELVKNCSVELSKPSVRLGYSKGVIRGIQNCKTELIGFMDADGQCDPNDLWKLTSYLQPGQLAVGYRNPRNDSNLRIFYSKAFGIAYKLFGGPKRKDPSSPFIVARFADIESLGLVDPKLSFGFWWEFQIRVKKLGLNVLEIPVNHRVRAAGTTQVYSIRKIPKIVLTHLSGLWKLKRELEAAE